jgi:hypothetical protein
LGMLLGLARIAALAAGLALAGCVTTESSLSQSDVAGMRLTGVTVSYAPAAFIQWEDGVRAYAASKGSAETAVPSVARTPEGKAYVQNLLATRIKAGIENAMAGRLNGTRPVRLEVVVKRFDIPSAVMTIIADGGRGMNADANLVDARTGALIVANPDLGAYLPSGGGLVGTAVQAAIDNSAEQSPADKLVARYGENYRDWLLRSGV